MILTVHTLGTWFLALQAIVSLRAGCRTVIAGPAGCTDAAASVRIARGVVQASANLITIFTIVTARTVRLAINALGSVRIGSVRFTDTDTKVIEKQTSARQETQIRQMITGKMCRNEAKLYVRTMKN